MKTDDLVRFTFAKEPVPVSLERADLYRKLTRSIHHDILRIAFPRTLELLGSEAMGASIDQFLEEGGPGTLQYPRVPDDFIEWATESQHPQADLLDYERATVRAERHPAEIDHRKAPSPAEPMALNPTLQVSSHFRPVHEISPDNPDPPIETNPRVYLAWRCPITDTVARQRVGLVIGRCLGLIGTQALTREEWIQEALDTETGNDPESLRSALLETHRDLVSRSGLFSAE
ncbi:MAG: hypothetical protein CMJ28_04370 [Phycisphaerae bacterium]|nr:hypothetical protein [Phycisphaerae bacterium]